MPSNITNQHANRIIREIASSLIKNHLQNSLEQSEWPALVTEEVLQDRVERRVIAIVGAGASKIAGLPLASEALQKLKDESSMPSKALDAEVDRLAQIYNLSREAFETYLRALSTSVFEAQRLRDNLQKMYGHRFMPVLAYEILAHMLKHRFLDAIINFNFDELLDQAIEDELDPEEYYHILSDGDCPDEAKLRETYPELPFYIKPHGTAGHKSTLRFTREDYYGLPLDIQRVLKHLLTEKPVVLLVIGFGMQSFEFNLILEGAAPSSKMFHINSKNPIKNQFLPKFHSKEWLNITSIGGTNEALMKIWQSVYNGFREDYKPRDITRHILVTQTFYRDINEHNVERYLRGRAVIELCLSIAKGKGLVTMSQLSNDRSGRYFDHLKSINGDVNFYEMCKNIGLKDIGYSREAMRLMKEERQISNILSEAEFDNEIDFLYTRVQDNLEPYSRNQLSKSLFRETLLELYRGQEVELRYRPDNPYTKVFRFPKPIPTYTAFKFHTQEILKQNWKYLFLVAETGQWLTEPHVISELKHAIKKDPDKKIYLILTDLSWEQRLRDEYGDTIINIKVLPWWEHNRHMTILVDQNRIPFASIYFSRRLRSSNIIPVLLNNVDDSRVVLESFNAYWLKAIAIEENERGFSWISSSDAKNFDKFFDLIHPTHQKTS